MMTRPAFLAAALALFSSPALSAEPGQIVKGRALAFQLCASCHQVSPEQRRPMRVYNPKTHEAQQALSLMEIARGNGRDIHFLENILEEPHYPMRRTALSSAEQQAIIAYIQSLRNLPR
jgi:mono/diheme cytochrome c family protein